MAIGESGMVLGKSDNFGERRLVRYVCVNDLNVYVNVSVGWFVCGWKMGKNKWSK